MSKALTRVIVLAGDPDSGKTTLLNAIYEKFLDGPFAGYQFAGSETLPGFEKRCHPARMDSFSPQPDTERTTQEKYLHLKVKKIETVSNGARNLLFSDIPGEYFENARNSEDLCHQMSVIRRADYLLLLLDGKRLVNLQERNNVIVNGRSLLRSFLDADMLGGWSMVDVLFTKYDEMQGKLKPEELESLITNVTDRIKSQCANRLQRLRFQRIAARPEPSSNLAEGYGLDELFPFWVEDSAQFARMKPHHQLTGKQTTGREFDLFLERELPAYC